MNMISFNAAVFLHTVNRNTETMWWKDSTVGSVASSSYSGFLSPPKNLPAGDATLPISINEYVCAWCPAIDGCPIQGLKQEYTRCSWDRLCLSATTLSRIRAFTEVKQTMDEQIGHRNIKLPFETKVAFSGFVKVVQIGKENMSCTCKSTMIIDRSETELTVGEQVINKNDM